MEPTHPFYGINLERLEADLSLYMEKVQTMGYELESVFYSLCDLYYLDPELMNLLGCNSNPVSLVNIINDEIEAAVTGNLIP